MFALLVAVVVLGCTDAFAPAPNTDLGLYVWAEVEPAVISLRDSTREIRIRILVENPSGSEIRVVSGGPPYVFTHDPTMSRGLGSAFRTACEESLLNCGPNTDWFGDSVYVFQPHLTRSSSRPTSLREWRAGGWTVTARTYHIRAWFNGREGQSATLKVVP